MTSHFYIKRFAAGLIQIVLITALTWFIFFVVASMTGANPANRYAGKAASAEQVERVAHQLGTDQSYIVQYARHMWRLLQGDFGYSFQQGLPVMDIILPAAATTASLVLGAAVIWLLVAIPVGVIGALRPRSHVDRALLVLVLLGMSMPVFWLAPAISHYLGYEPTQGRVLGVDIGHSVSLFPIDGYVDFRDDPIGWAHHLFLPWITLAIGFAAIYARYVRALTIEQLSEDYTRTARAKGASESRILRRHTGPNVAPTIVTLLALDIGAALGGAVFVEAVFNLPGLGFVALSSIQNFDYPLTVGVITFAALVAVLANTVADVVQAALDPRVRLQGR
jgi:peptide/nickel transport system permease protein